MELDRANASITQDTFNFQRAVAADSPTAQVSVVVPVYNGVQFVEGAIRSILSQTVRPRQVIVVDDCSTDGTADLLLRRFRNDEDVMLLQMRRNSGPSACRNVGIAKCRTPFIAFLDADDEWHSRHLEIALHTLKHCDADVYCSGLRTGSSAEMHICHDIVSDPLAVLLRDNFITQSAAVIRAEAIAPNALGRSQPYDESRRHAEDFELWLQLALRGQRFVRSNAPTLIRRVHAGQVSAGAPAKMYTRAWEARRMAVQSAHGNRRRIDDLHRELAYAAEADLLSAWNRRDRATIVAVLKAVSWVPGIDALRDRWQQRVGMQWPLWRALAAGYDAMPRSARGAVKSILPYREPRTNEGIASG